jgi:hypothetical protein
VFPPDAGWLLNPLINTSAICVPRLSEDDLGYLLEHLGGFRINLAASEAVLFPSLWWHAVRYHAPSMSISIRFAEQRRLRPFAVLPRSFWLQRVVWELFRSKAGAESAAIVARCLEQFFRPRKNWLERYLAMNALYRCCLVEMSQSRGAEYLGSDDFNSELNAVGTEIQDIYDFQPRIGASKTTKGIEDTRQFLFGNGKSTGVPYKTQCALAHYALAKKQGLEPRRGLVAIHQAGHQIAGSAPHRPPTRSSYPST